MLLSTNTTNQKGFRAAQEVKAKNLQRTDLDLENLLGQKKTSVYPSVEKNTKLRLWVRLCGAGAGDETRILRYKLCNLVGKDFLIC